MDADNFNYLYEEIVMEKLQKHGYSTKGQSLFFTNGTLIAALLRSTFRGEQATDIVFCVRHTFLRDYLKLTTKNIYLKEAIDYPFRFLISEFTEADLFRVNYKPVNYRNGSKELPSKGIYYGDTEVEDARKIKDQLELMTNNIIKYGPQIMNILNPKKAFEYITRNNTGAWIEKVWLEDYENHINGRN